MEQILLLFYYASVYIFHIFKLYFRFVYCFGLLHFTFFDRAEKFSLANKVNSKLNSSELT